MVMATPAPSSIAPVPRSQESRCAPISTTSLVLPRPVISPMTLWEIASPFQPQSSARSTLTGPRASSRASWSASGLASDAEGTGVSPASKRVMPVWATRWWSVPAERIRKPMAPARIAAEGPFERIAPPLR